MALAGKGPRRGLCLTHMLLLAAQGFCHCHRAVQAVVLLAVCTGAPIQLGICPAWYEGLHTQEVWVWIMPFLMHAKLITMPL